MRNKLMNVSAYPFTEVVKAYFFDYKCPHLPLLL